MTRLFYSPKARKGRALALPVVLLASLSASGALLTGCGSGSGTSYVNGIIKASPTPTPGGIPTPRPSATPTPNATPTPIPSATPTPAPNNQTLAAYFGTQANAARLTYRDTTTTTYPDPISGQSTSNTETTTYSTTNGDPFASGEVGAKTTVTLATAQGNVTVTRQEERDNGKVVGYTYFSLDPNAYALYGSDVLDEQGRVTQETRYSVAARFALSLLPGQSQTQTVTVTQTTIDPETGARTSKSFTQTLTLRYIGVESVTVPAGTYANTAHVTLDLEYKSVAQNGEPRFNVLSTVNTYHSASVGMVKSSLFGTFESTFTNPETGQNQTMTTKINGVTELISIAK